MLVGKFPEIRFMRFLQITFMLMLLITAAAGAQITDRWLQTDLADAQRDTLIEESKIQNFKEVAPVLLKVLVEYRPLFGHYNYSGEKPWNDKRLEPKQRNFVAAEIVWSHHLRGTNDPAKARVLRTLIPPGNTNPHSRYLIVDALTHSQWTPELEPVLEAMLTDKSRTSDAKRHALDCLLHRCDINTYMPLAIQRIRSTKGLSQQLREYNYLTNHGNDLFTLSKANHRELTDLGFNLLQRLPHKQPGTGYFVALQLGFLLKIKDQFKPDQDAEKYQSPSGLKPGFFTDTVKNALAWHTANRR